MKSKNLTNEQLNPIRGQSQPQPEQARRRILVFPMRQHSRTRDLVRGSSRTDQDYAFRPRISGLINRPLTPALAAAGPVLETKAKAKTTTKTTPSMCRGDGVTPIREGLNKSLGFPSTRATTEILTQSRVRMTLPGRANRLNQRFLARRRGIFVFFAGAAGTGSLRPTFLR